MCPGAAALLRFECTFIDLSFMVCGLQVCQTRSSDAESSALTGVMCLGQTLQPSCCNMPCSIRIGCVWCADHSFLPACFSWALQSLMVKPRMSGSLQAN